MLQAIAFCAGDERGVGRNWLSLVRERLGKPGAAEEPATITSALLLSNSRLTKRSRPGTSWISSKHQSTVPSRPASGTQRPYSSKSKPSWFPSRPASRSSSKFT